MGLPPSVELTSGRVARKWVEWALATHLMIFGSLVLLARPDQFDSPVYLLLWSIAPLEVWGILWFGLGITRMLTLKVNGHWPVSPFVRLGFCIASFLTAWAWFCLSFWWFALRDLLEPGSGGLLSGVILAPMVGWVEIMAAVQLYAWSSHKRHAARAEE